MGSSRRPLKFAHSMTRSTSTVRASPSGISSRTISSGRTWARGVKRTCASRAAGEHPAALDAQVRFTPRAQVRPDEIVRLLIPDGDARTVDVERVMLWANFSGRLLDPIQLLSTQF